MRNFLREVVLQKERGGFLYGAEAGRYVGRGARAGGCAARIGRDTAHGSDLLRSGNRAEFAEDRANADDRAAVRRANRKTDRQSRGNWSASIGGARRPGDAGDDCASAEKRFADRMLDGESARSHAHADGGGRCRNHQGLTGQAGRGGETINCELLPDAEYAST